MTAIIKPRHGTIESRVEEQGATIRSDIRVDFASTVSRQVRAAPFLSHLRRRGKRRRRRSSFEKETSGFYYRGGGKKKTCEQKICSDIDIDDNDTTTLPLDVFLSLSSSVYLNFKFENLNSTPSTLPIHFLSL